MELYVAFLLASTALLAAPGPSMLLVAAYSARAGLGAAVAATMGASLGVAAQLALAGLGFASLLASAGPLFAALRWAGVVYLISLAIREWRVPAVDEIPDAPGNGFFARGLFVALLNPKGLLFAGAFFPPFIDPNAPLSPQLVLLMASFLVLNFAVSLAYAGVGRQAERLASAGGLHRASATALSAAALWLACERRP